MATWDLLAGLEVHIEGYELEGRSRSYGSGFERVTTTFALQGGGEEGRGEDVCYTAELQKAQLQRGPTLPLAGTYTLAGFSAHLDEVDLFPDGPPHFPDAEPRYRRWALESAAADLALRQAGTTLHAVLGREPQPVRFVVSCGLGDPPAIEPVTRRLACYPQLRFKLDAVPEWKGELLEQLAATGTVDVIDLKGAYRGTPVDVDTDPELYWLVAEAFHDAWLEDPDLTVPDADAALHPHRRRITWDAVIHTVAEIEALPFKPRTLNLKPSRFGSWQELLDTYDHCEREGIGLYGGGQAELGVGRGQIQLLASMFHPGAPNDIAPAGYDHEDFPEAGLEDSPLDPRPEATGFRRAGLT